MVIALVASMLTIFARTPDATACSVAPPMLEVGAADALEPGRPLTVRGYGFNDMTVHPWEESYDAEGNPIPQHSCAGIELIPMEEVTLSWIGERTEVLAVVTGPDFTIEVTVPEWAQPGPAIINANGFEAYVHVGIVDPCPVHLTADEPSLQVWSPECPEPCLGGPAIDVWCPEPCLPTILHEVGLHEVGLHDAGYCPGPCPLITVNVAAPTESSGTADVSPAGCPDPCWGAVDLLCPIPEPLPLPEAPLPEAPLPEAPLPEPDPVPLPEPFPEPRPLPCLLHPDGTIMCPATVPALETDRPTISARAETSAATESRASVVRRDTETVPAPPRPFIDFDGCRSDGADACG